MSPALVLVLDWILVAVAGVTLVATGALMLTLAVVLVRAAFYDEG